MPPKKPTPAKKTDKGNSSGKKAPKKWSKGKTREALDNAVLFEKATMDKLMTEVPKYKVITPSIVSDRLKVSIALAKAGLKHLAKNKLVTLVSTSNTFQVYSRAKVEEVKEE